MIERKNISLWLDKDLVKILSKLNYKYNKPLLEHEFKCFFYIYNIAYLPPYEPLNISEESFINSESTAKTMSNIVMKMKRANSDMIKVVHNFNFLKHFL
uniref:Uncharacterized protein n=1 Tax=Grateloupia filicina TaxID=31455 RepID=A0A2S1FXD4_9FLOR|nr:hypothetical protein Grafi_p226 [Grateloupia filicina]AWD77410.1 hypothetical protein Grafi_p226 [Grateloupia filicina]